MSTILDKLDKFLLSYGNFFRGSGFIHTQCICFSCFDILCNYTTWFWHLYLQSGQTCCWCYKTTMGQV